MLPTYIASITDYRPITVEFNKQSVRELSTLLNADVDTGGEEAILRIGGKESGPAIVLSVAFLKDGTGVLSAQTSYGYFELHAVKRYVPVEPDEVIFVAEEDSRVSGLVVGRRGNCSLFANVDRAILSGDLGALEPALLLASMQLGLTEVVPT